MSPKVISLFCTLVLTALIWLPINQATAQDDSVESISNSIQSGTYAIPENFFGMSINDLGIPWPNQEFTGQRLLASNVGWANLETSPGVYDWKWLDEWVAQAQAHNISLIYTFNDVPQFYSSKPGDTNCAYGNTGTGACDPPDDLNADGTGTDAHFKSFVNALVSHVGNKIQYWEIWNEPNQDNQWTPTNPNLPYSQLVRMEADARTIIKDANSSALILTPSSIGFPNGAPDWMAGYLAAGGGTNADVIAFHSYVNHRIFGQYPIAENVVPLIQSLKAVMTKYNQQSKPLWITESGWGKTQYDGFTNESLQTAFTARFILLEASAGAARAYWFQWDGKNGAGTLWQPNSLRTPGIAYEQIHAWLLGATLSVPCAAKGTVWTCTLTRSGGYQAMAVWNTAGNSSFTFPSQYKQYINLSGKVTSTSGSTVSIGTWPILLEN
jgi:polysaccharide biosynthesis protein PslG